MKLDKLEYPCNDDLSKIVTIDDCQECPINNNCGTFATMLDEENDTKK